MCSWTGLRYIKCDLVAIIVETEKSVSTRNIYICFVHLPKGASCKDSSAVTPRCLAIAGLYSSGSQLKGEIITE